MVTDLGIRTNQGILNMNDLADRITARLKSVELHFYASPVPEGGYFIIEVRGDWKHEHARVDLNVRKLFEELGIQHFDIYRVPTAPSDSDYYEANHHIMMLSWSLAYVEGKMDQ